MCERNHRIVPEMNGGTDQPATVKIEAGSSATETYDARRSAGAQTRRNRCDSLCEPVQMTTTRAKAPAGLIESH